MFSKDVLTGLLILYKKKSITFKTVDRTTNNNWTDQKRYRLVSLIHFHSGHIKTETALKDKCGTILQLFTANYSDMSFRNSNTT